MEEVHPEEQMVMRTENWGTLITCTFLVILDEKSMINAKKQHVTECDIKWTLNAKQELALINSDKFYFFMDGKF